MSQNFNNDLGEARRALAQQGGILFQTAMTPPEFTLFDDFREFQAGPGKLYCGDDWFDLGLDGGDSTKTRLYDCDKDFPIIYDEEQIPT